MKDDYRIDGESETIKEVSNPLESEVQKPKESKQEQITRELNSSLDNLNLKAVSKDLKVITNEEYERLTKAEEDLRKKEHWFKAYFKSPTFLNTCFIFFLSSIIYLADSSKIWNLIGNKISQAQNQSSTQTPPK